MDIRTDPVTDPVAWGLTVQLWKQFDFSADDAANLELARRLVLPLATPDRAFFWAERWAGVDVLKAAVDGYTAPHTEHYLAARAYPLYLGRTCSLEDYNE